MKRIGKRVAEADRKDLKGSMSDWDRKNLQFLIAFYEKAYPGVISYHAVQARKEVEPIVRQKTHIKKNDISLSKRMSMPKDLMLEIKRGYPNIISDKNQFEQFLRWFPVFDLWQK